MGWPSVHFWGWALVPGRFVLFFGALMLAGALSDLGHRLWGSAGIFPYVFVGVLLSLAAACWVLLACPRCGRSAYTRGSFLQNNLWPARTCTKCGLDLARHHPMDRRARRTREVSPSL